MTRARRAAGSFGAMTDERHPHDLYETPFEAVKMLFDNHKFGVGNTIDPSCGRGMIIKHIQKIDPDRPIIGTDLHSYRPVVSRDIIGYGIDFEKATRNQIGNAKHIIMNPPYKAADAHVRKALELVPRGGVVASLMRLNWMAAQKRREFLSVISKIIIVGRIKMLPPDVEDKGYSGTVDFAWFVFDTKHHSTDGTEIVRA